MCHAPRMRTEQVLLSQQAEQLRLSQAARRAWESVVEHLLERERIVETRRAEMERIKASSAKKWAQRRRLFCIRIVLRFLMGNALMFFLSMAFHPEAPVPNFPSAHVVSQVDFRWTPTPPFTLGPVHTQNNGIIYFIDFDNFSPLKDDGGDKLVEFENLVEHAYKRENAAAVTKIPLVEWAWAFAKEHPVPHVYFVLSSFHFGKSLSKALSITKH